MTGAILPGARGLCTAQGQLAGSKRAAILLQAARPSAHCLPAQQHPARGSRSLLCSAADQDSDAALTGEWPVNWSLASYEDVGEFFQNELFKDTAAPGTTLQDVMATSLTTTTPDAKKDDVARLFADVSGLPVVKSSSDMTLVGVVSKKDLSKPGTTVKDIMSTPPVAARANNKVADAAALMLKHKVHRIPVVDPQAKVVGIVTRTDIFNALGA